MNYTYLIQCGNWELNRLNELFQHTHNYYCSSLKSAMDFYQKHTEKYSYWRITKYNKYMCETILERGNWNEHTEFEKTK